VYRNNVNIGTVATPSFVDTTVTANTTYTYKVTAYNSTGESVFSSGSTVTTMQNTNTNPTVPTGLTSTSSGTQVTITWIASTGSLTGYKVYRNGTLVGQTTGATAYTETVSPGTYSYTVSAFNASFESAQSIPVVVTIGNQADTTAPVVALTSPINGEAISGGMTVAATATDNVGVTSVLFRIDGVQYGSEDFTAPYMTSVDSIALSNGVHTVTATARDAAGNSSVASSAITVTNTGALMYKTTARVNVRNNPTTWIGGSILGTQPVGAIGSVIPGTSTVNANGYTWVKLNFPTGADGWVVTRYLSVYNGSQTGKITNTVTATTPVLVDTDTTMRAMELLQQASRVSTSAEANRLIAEAQALMKR
jgi:fibronectin type 3 domain-containing protein